MFWLLVYCIAAVAIAYTGLCTLYLPALRQAQRLGVVNDYTYSPKLSCIVIFLAFTLLAPWIVFAACSMERWIVASTAFYTIVTEPYKI